MSLTVDVFVADADAPSGRRVLDVPEDGADLAGPERARTELWGSAVVRALGVATLPGLAGSDLWIENDEVPSFRRECELLLAHVDEIAGTTGYRPDLIRHRLTNMVHAADRALREGGGVVVW